MPLFHSSSKLKFRHFFTFTYQLLLVGSKTCWQHNVDLDVQVSIVTGLSINWHTFSSMPYRLSVLRTFRNSDLQLS